MQFSWIITFRKTREDRYELLMDHLNWLSKLKLNFEVIVVEQDKAPKIDFNLPRVRKIFVENPGLFNRSWGFNVGVKQAKTNLLFFSDSDIYVDPNSIRQTIGLLRDFQAISPFKRMIDLDVQTSTDVRQSQRFIPRKGKPRGGAGFCAGLTAYTREGFEKIWGWDERFQGWGGEDDIQWFKTKQLLNHKTLNFDCYHLWHSRDAMNGTNKHPNYKKNLQLFWKYYKNQKSILIEGIQSDWGNSKKYLK